MEGIEVKIRMQLARMIEDRKLYTDQKDQRASHYITFSVVLASSEAIEGNDPERRRRE